MAYSADQEIKVVIRTVYDGAGGKTALGDLRLLVEQARAGNKEAADALDHWRNTQGRGRGSGLSNTGSGLATSPSMQGPGYSGPLPPVYATPGASAGAGGGANMGGLQSLLSRATGGGLVAAASAYGAIGVALHKVIGLYVQWNKEAESNLALMRQYETVGLRIDNLGLSLQKNLHRNQEFNQSWEQMSIRVHSVANEVQHLLHLDEQRISAERTLFEATHARDVAQNAFQNHFNPLGKIKEQAKLEKEAAEQRLQFDKELEQKKLKAIELEQELSAARGGAFAKESAEIKKALPDKEKAADTAADELQTAEALFNKKKATLEMERAALQRLVEGRGHIGATKDLISAGISRSALGLDGGGEALTAASGALSSGVGGLLGMGGGANTGIYQKRIGEIDASLRGAADQRNVARGKARATSQDVQMALKRMGFADEEAMRAGESFKKAEVDRQFTEEEIRQRNELRGPTLDRTKEAIDINSRNQQLDAIRPGNISVPGGGVSNTNQQLLDRLDTLAQQNERMIGIWQGGGVASAA